MVRMVSVGLLALCTMPAQADSLPLLVDAPATYTPGEAFNVDVRLPGAVELTGFNIEFLFTSTVLNPDFLVTAQAVAGSYPFGDTSNFHFSLAHDPDSEVQSVTIYTDPDNGPVNTVGGLPDLLGRITITPGANVVGPIQISVNNGDNFRLDIGGEPPPDITLPELTINPNEPTAPVPTPAAWLSLGLGGLLLMVRRKSLRVVAP